LSSNHHHIGAPFKLFGGNMNPEENNGITIEEKNGVTIIIPRPKDMNIDRFTTLIARLEKIVDQLGGTLNVKSE
tara:strand:- start:704 stop:925 length:222 start_codon:yes stop_codon:yes gene_type:complete